MVLHDHLQNVEAATEDTASQCTVLWPPLLVCCHIVNDLYKLGRDTEEGGLVEAVVDQLAQHLQSAVQLPVGGMWDELKEVFEEVGPLVWVVGGSDLADDQTGGSLELAVEVVGRRQLKQLWANLGLGLVGDQYLALELIEVGTPPRQHQLLQRQQRSLADVEGDAVMAGDADEAEGQLLVAVEALELLLGVFARCLLRRLGRGQQSD